MNHPRLFIVQLVCAACLGCGGVDDADAPMLGFSDGRGTGGPVGSQEGSPTSGGAARGSNSNPGGGVDGSGGGAGNAGGNGGSGAGIGGAAGFGTDDGTIPGPAGPGGEAAPGGPPGQPATATGSSTIMDNVGESGNDQVPGFYGAGADIGLRERPGP